MTELEVERDAILHDIRNALQSCDCPEAQYGACQHDQIVDEVYFVVKAGMEKRSAESA